MSSNKEEVFTPKNCDVCGEFECESCDQYESHEDWDDGSWMFNGSGMVGDD